MKQKSESLVERLVGVCLQLLAASVAVYLAVRLIEVVWVALVIILVVSACVAAFVMVLRNRRRDW